MLGGFGWFEENSGKHVHPPKELRPSQRGLFDLHGNLLEWTHDWHSDFEAEAITDPLGAKRGSIRVHRGGSWLNEAAYCRSAYRRAGMPSFRGSMMGFRLALSPSSNATEAEKSKGAEPAGVGTEGAPAEQRP